MILVKTFNTRNFTQKLFATLENSGAFEEDGVGIYRVGDFVTEFEMAQEDEKWRYRPFEVEDMRELDDYLISQGAVKGEEVFIYHGTYHQFWNRIK